MNDRDGSTGSGVVMAEVRVAGMRGACGGGADRDRERGVEPPDYEQRLTGVKLQATERR
jgi:hypothetical protein